MSKILLSSMLIGTLLIAGCQTVGQKEGLGTLAGAGLGGLAGSQIGGGKGRMIAVGAGVLFGALAGNSIGSSLDKADRAAINQSTQIALERSPSGRRTDWRNPDSGNSGSVIPSKTFERQGTYCREFTQTVSVAGKEQSAYGTACRQPDGTWQIQ